MTKKNKRKIKLISPRIFTMLFALLFVVSLFFSISALAESKPLSITSASIIDKSEGVTGNITNYTDDEVNSNIEFHKLNDYATYKIDIKSNEDEEITITSITDDNNNEYVDYEYDKHENEKLSPGKTLNFESKAVYTKEVTDTSKRKQTIHVKFIIKYLKDGKEKEADINVNPKTGDNIYISVILLIISSIGLVISITLEKKRKMSKLSGFIITLLVLSPVIVKAAEYTYEFKINSVIGLYDKLVVRVDDKVDPVITKVIKYNTKIDSLPTPTKTGYTLTKWKANGTEFDINEKITSDITIEAEYRANKYTIRFNPNVPSGEQDPSETMEDLIMTYDKKENLPANKYTISGYTFDSWNTKADGTGTRYEDKEEINNLTETDGQIITLYAIWNSMICKKATVLNTDICNNTSTKTACQASGYELGEKITYGKAVNSDTLVSGDALDCNVDGTGYNKRFYYLTSNGNNAVLIANTNYPDSDNNYIYEDAPSKLPTTSEWNNLPITFEIAENDFRPARFITLDEIKAAAGRENVKSVGSLDHINYLFENTSYSKNTGRSTVWIKQEADGTRSRYHKDNRTVLDLTEENYYTSKNAVRPVIEVPKNLIVDDYIIHFEPNGGTINEEYKRITKGASLGTLPSVQKQGYLFDGWYTSPDYITKIDENEVPNGYLTYYAKWLADVEQAETDKENYTIKTGDTSQIIINNINELEPFTYSSNNEAIATITDNGLITAVAEGNTKITLYGTISHKTKTVNVYVVPEIVNCIVSFNTQGGIPVEDKTVTKNSEIGQLPTTTKADYIFDGWYTSLNYDEKVTTHKVITDNITLYAKWIPVNAVAEMNNEYYTKIQDAVDEAGSNKTTITLLKDVTQTTVIDLFTTNTNKNIVLDLNGHTLTNNQTNVIKTKATLEIKNGTIQTSASSGAIDIGSGGKLIMNSGRIEATGTRQAVYNDGGTVEIGGDAYLSAKADGSNTGKRATVHNVSGTLKITGGTIISNRSSDSYAISINSGTVTIGTKDNIHDTNSIVIKANTYGIYSDVNYSLYDGIAKGIISAVNDEEKITATEDHAQKINGTENIDGTIFKTLYYEVQ